MVKYHTVKPGDTLPSIAECYYGTEDAWQFIYRHNDHHIVNPNNLYVGQTIVIPHAFENQFRC